MRAPTSGGKRAGEHTSEEFSFTRALCHRHRAWAVDATGCEELPPGWQTLALDLFDDIAAAVAGRKSGMLVVRGLRQGSGGLEVDLDRLRDTANAVRAFRAVRRLAGRARRHSERTCTVCGEDGRKRNVGGLCAPLCDAHAEDPGARPFGEIDPDLLVGERRSRPDGIERARVPIGPPPSEHHRLYDVADVEAALGHTRLRQGAPIPPPTIVGEPDDFPIREVDTDHQAYLRALLGAGEAGALRTLAHPGTVSLAELDRLHACAPHMAEVTALVRRHLAAAFAMGLPTSLPAIMLLGEPGTGKTWYLSRLAALLGIPHRRYPMSGQSLADGLVGGHPTWRNAQPGLVARTLLAERSANPLVLVDEVDKARTHAMEDPYRGLYDLLEPEGARAFTDEYLGFPLDASRVLWVLAGNDLAPLPAPVVDRLTVITVPTPGEAHLRVVVASVYRECNAARRDFFRTSASEAVVARLLETTPRVIRKAIAEAMTRAAADGRRALSPDDIVIPAPPRRRIGFR